MRSLQVCVLVAFLAALGSPRVVSRRALVTGPDLVEARELVLTEVYLEGTLRALELLHRAGADDRRGNHGLVQEPCDPDVGGRLAEIGAELLVGLDGIAQALQSLRRAPGEPALTLLLLAKHAREHPPVQGAPRDDTYPEVGARWQDLQFDLTLGKVVDRLLGDQARRVPSAS